MLNFIVVASVDGWVYSLSFKAEHFMTELLLSGRSEFVPLQLDQSTAGCTVAERKLRTRARGTWRGHAVGSSVTSFIQAAEWRLEN